MEVVEEKDAVQARTSALRAAGLRLGLVPTMGALHAGHLSLVERARSECDRVLVSIFVNPLQFAPGEDLARYPRDLDGDLAKLRQAGCDLVFAPPASAMYEPAARTFVRVSGLSDALCGRSRPGHFEGVTTVVAKLFHLLQPHVAVFGQKDAQQAVLIRRMVRDLDFPVRLRFAPIVRDPDGLALSSRNAYLSAEERTEALLLPAALRRARRMLESGERRAGAIRTAALAVLESGAHVRVDYVELVDPEKLEPLETVEGRVLVALAAVVGRTRLIDNMLLEVLGASLREIELEG